MLPGLMTAWADKTPQHGKNGGLAGSRLSSPEKSRGSAGMPHLFSRRVSFPGCRRYFRVADRAMW